MNVMQKYYDYSHLSFVAYVEKLKNGILSETDTRNFRQADLVDTQIDQLIEDGWTVVQQSSDDLYSDSGFSATLFHNAKTGEYVFANHELDSLQ